jgi:oxygen-dependent protoporphyrinogen oxidase
VSIIIVGGGIAGLSAAFEAARRGVRVRLLEASSRVGGLIRTEHVDGFTVEAGPESVLAQKPAAIELCDALGIGSRLVASTPPRTAFVLRDGRLHPLPSPSVLGIPLTLRATARYSLLPIPARIRLAMEPWIPAQAIEDESVAAFFRRRFGAATVDLVAEPLLGGIHAGAIETLSVRSLFPRLVDAEARRGSVVRAFRTQSAPAAGNPAPGISAGAPGTSAGLFRSLIGGMSELVDALERQLPPGSIQCEAPVSAIEREGDGFRVTTPGSSASARAVILAVPARVAATLLAPIDEAAARLCAEVPYVSTVSVSLGFPRAAVAHPLAGSGFVVARKHDRSRITACTWVSSKWAGRAPAGSVLLRAFVGGAHDPAAVDLDDRSLIDLALSDLAPVLGITGPPQLARVHRWRNAGAQHNVGQLARVAAIESRLALHRGLLVAGSGFRSVGIPDCIVDGRAAGAAAVSLVEERS